MPIYLTKTTWADGIVACEHDKSDASNRRSPVISFQSREESNHVDSKAL
jgi:hypothetical protein